MSAWLPITGWLPRYRRGWLSGDIVGAFTAWAIVVPESVAYAEIAGVPPQNAFYAAPVALAAYAVFGSSRHLVVGTTSAAAIVSASTVAGATGDPAQTPVFAAALAIMAGLILVVAGLLRLGFVANFLAEPVLVGFLFGMALVIMVRQAGKLLGISSGDGNFFRRLGHLLANLDRTSLTTLAVGAAALVALLARERFAGRLPAALIVLVAGIALAALLNLSEHGVAIVGTIPSAVPVPAIPDVAWSDLLAMLGGAFGLALVVFAESYSISARFAAKHGYDVDANQELVAMGAANATAGLFKGFAVSGSASRTAAVEAAGGRSAMASLIAAALVLVTAAFLTPLFTDLPEAVLGAIVIVAVRGFLRVGELRRYARLQPAALAVALTALVGVLVFDLLPGLLIAVTLSLALYIGTTSSPRLTSHQDRGLLTVRPDGQLYFGSVDRVRGGIAALVARATTSPLVVLLDLSGSFGLGVAVTDTLRELHDQLTRDRRELWLTGLHARSADMIERSGLADAIGRERIFDMEADAQAAYQQRFTRSG